MTERPQSVAPPAPGVNRDAEKNRARAVTPANSLRALPLHWIGVGASVLVLLGCLGPWLDALFATRSGLSTADGKLVAIIGMIVIALAARGRAPAVISVLGVVA